MQQAKLYSFQVESVFDGVESSADVRVHSQLGAAVIQLVLSGPSEDFFYLLETEEFNDEGPRSTRASISRSGAEGAVSSLYLGPRYRHKQVRCKLGRVLVSRFPRGY